jgi:fatty acyl-CoA reductase
MDCIGDRGTEVQEFYRGANVLITGGTGFMGKVLMEKLLRSCPHLSNIYVLIRSKKGKDAETRLEDIFNDPVRTRFFDSKIISVELCKWEAVAAGF